MNAPSSQRRFELAKGHPEDVQPLDESHAALRDMRTLFPSTVIEPKDSPALLISGHNNAKIGKVVTKGEWKGMPIYTLTLEERATCPPTCFMLSACYGNAMHMARRHRHGKDLEAYLQHEIAALAEEHRSGFVVRLHVLGDFYSVDYVRFWQRMLKEHEALHLFGYTARKPGAADGIGTAVVILNNTAAGRCFIRFSAEKPQKMGATVIMRLPEASIVAEGVVCPAETSDTECCATCGLCWSSSMRDKTIVFVAHGKGATETKAEVRALQEKKEGGVRELKPLARAGIDIKPISGRIIGFPSVAPERLRVDERYQRQLSAKSLKHIRAMMTSWDWGKFTPPTVVKDGEDAFHVIDGQHTAIAAASRGDIAQIPVKLIEAETLHARAATFVGINRDRMAVTAMQIFYAAVAAGDAKATAVKAMADDAGIVILRQPPPRNVFGPGETMAVASIQKLHAKYGPVSGLRVLNICVASRLAPVSDWMIGAVQRLLFDPEFQPRMEDAKILDIMRSMGRSLNAAAYQRHAKTEERMPIAAAHVIWEKRK